MSPDMSSDMSNMRNTPEVEFGAFMRPAPESFFRSAIIVSYEKRTSEKIHPPH
jgi:hypothetical protein